MPSTKAMAALQPMLLVCSCFGVALVRPGCGLPGLLWTFVVITALVAVSIDMAVREWALHLQHVSMLMVMLHRGLAVAILGQLVLHRRRVAGVLEEVLAVVDECGRLVHALPKALSASRTAVTMALFVASDVALLAWDWSTGARFYWPSVVVTMQLSHAISKLALVVFAAQVRLLAVAMADVNQQLASLARLRHQPGPQPSGCSSLRRHPVRPLQALHMRLGCAAGALGGAWGGVLLAALLLVFTALWGEAAWNVAGMLRGLYGHHSSIRPSLAACRMATLFAVLLYVARTCDALQRQAEFSALLVHGILNRDDTAGDDLELQVEQFALQLVASRGRFTLSVCSLFDINSGLVTTMVNTVGTYLSIQVPISLAAMSQWKGDLS